MWQYLGHFLWCCKVTQLVTPNGNQTQLLQSVFTWLCKLFLFGCARRVEVVFFTMAVFCTVFWTCAENRLVEMFSLLLSSAYTEKTSFCTAMLSRKLGVHEKTHSQNRWHKLTRGTFQTRENHVQYIKQGKGEGSAGHLRWWCLSSPVTMISWMAEQPPSPNWFSLFALLVCMTFAFPVKLSLLNPWVLQILLFLFSP